MDVTYIYYDMLGTLFDANVTAATVVGTFTQHSIDTAVK